MVVARWKYTSSIKEYCTWKGSYLSAKISLQEWFLDSLEYYYYT